MSDSWPLSLRLYRTASTLATPFASRVMAQRLKRGKEDAARLDERRGVASMSRPSGPLIWVHGASVGEILAAAGLVEHLRGLGFHVLLTSGTLTSATIAARRFGDRVIHQYIPYDAPAFVGRFLDHWRPNLALLIESDLWPNLIMQSTKRNVPLALINGRLSQRSFERWMRARGTISALLNSFDICLTQTQADASRFEQLGATHIHNTGNLKLDVAAPPADSEKLNRLYSALRGRTLIAAASTHPGEDEMFIEAHHRLRPHHPGLLTLIIPRHPDRGEAIARMAAESGLQVALRSSGHNPGANTDIYVADTIGEMGLFYRLAPVVVMGGSLVPHGGQNPIEAIKLGAMVLHGPHVSNFAEVYAALDDARGAVCVDDGEALIAQLHLWLTNEPARNQVLANARMVVESLGGALQRTLAALEPNLMQARLEGGQPHA